MNGSFGASLQTATELVIGAGICDIFAADCNDAFAHEAQQNVSHSNRSHSRTFVQGDQASRNNCLIGSPRRQIVCKLS
eukprot:4639839-Ditylum_brightwellii.AAC.1